METASVDVARNDWTAEFNNQLPSIRKPISSSTVPTMEANVALVGITKARWYGAVGEMRPVVSQKVMNESVAKDACDSARYRLQKPSARIQFNMTGKDVEPPPIFAPEYHHLISRPSPFVPSPRGTLGRRSFPC